MKVKSVIFFPNGAFMSLSPSGEQISEWQSNLLCDQLRRMREAGVVDDDTELQIFGGQTTVGDYIERTA